jgi:hypothetical protein
MKVTWANVTENDTFVAWTKDGGCASLTDKSIQFAGTFGGATLTVEGSNDETNFVGLNDPQGSAISATSAAIEQILENTAVIRPSISGGSSSSVTVTIVARGVIQKN